MRNAHSPKSFDLSEEVVNGVEGQFAFVGAVVDRKVKREALK